MVHDRADRPDQLVGKGGVAVSARLFAGSRWRTFRTVVWDANRSITRTITARPTDRTVQVVVSVPQIRIGPELYRSAGIVKTIRRQRRKRTVRTTLAATCVFGSTW